MPTQTELRNVHQGEADVYFNGAKAGRVTRVSSHFGGIKQFGWIAYDRSGKLLTKDAVAYRDHAIDAVLSAV